MTLKPPVNDTISPTDDTKTSRGPSAAVFRIVMLAVILVGLFTVTLLMLMSAPKFNPVEACEKWVF
jgi:hypothetical protein